MDTTKITDSGRISAPPRGYSTRIMTFGRLICVAGAIAMIAVNLLMIQAGALWSWKVAAAIVGSAPFIIVGLLLQWHVTWGRKTEGERESKPAIGKFLVGWFCVFLAIFGAVLLLWVGVAKTFGMVGPPYYEIQRAADREACVKAGVGGEVKAFTQEAVFQWLAKNQPFGTVSIEVWFGLLSLLSGAFYLLLIRPNMRL